MSSIVRAISPEVPEPQPGTELFGGRRRRLSRGDAHYRAGPERRRHYRLLLLDAPPATPLRTTQYLDAAIALSLAPVFAPLCDHARSNRWMKDGLRQST